MKNRDVMLGSLKLHLSATRAGVTVSYYDQDFTHAGGMTRVRIGFLSPEELCAGAADAVIDITPILPIAADLFLAAGGNLEGQAA